MTYATSVHLTGLLKESQKSGKEQDKLTTSLSRLMFDFLGVKYSKGKSNEIWLRIETFKFLLLSLMYDRLSFSYPTTPLVDPPSPTLPPTPHTPSILHPPPPPPNRFDLTTAGCCLPRLSLWKYRDSGFAT